MTLKKNLIIKVFCATILCLNTQNSCTLATCTYIDQHLCGLACRTHTHKHTHTHTQTHCVKRSLSVSHCEPCQIKVSSKFFLESNSKYGKHSPLDYVLAWISTQDALCTSLSSSMDICFYNLSISRTLSLSLSIPLVSTSLLCFCIYYEIHHHGTFEQFTVWKKRTKHANCLHFMWIAYSQCPIL